MAAYKGHVEVVRALLQAGADKSLKDFAGNTAFDNANEQGHIACAALLS